MFWAILTTFLVTYYLTGAAYRARCKRVIELEKNAVLVDSAYNDLMEKHRKLIEDYNQLCGRKNDNLTSKEKEEIQELITRIERNE